MAGKNEKKKTGARPSVGLGLGGILDGIRKLVETAAELKESGEISQSGEFSVPGIGENGKGVFGFSIRTMAPDQGPRVRVRPFGNIHKTKEGLTVEEDAEPVVDVLEEGGQIRVIAEVPGVSAGDISYEIVGDVLTLSTKGSRRYHAEVLLPGPVETEGVEFSYNNGILELRLKKAKGGS